MDRAELLHCWPLATTRAPKALFLLVVPNFQSSDFSKVEEEQMEQTVDIVKPFIKGEMLKNAPVLAGDGFPNKPS